MTVASIVAALLPECVLSGIVLRWRLLSKGELLERGEQRVCNRPVEEATRWGCEVGDAMLFLTEGV